MKIDSKIIENTLVVLTFFSFTAYFMFSRYESENGLNIYGILASLIIGYLGAIFIKSGNIQYKKQTGEGVINKSGPIQWYCAPVLILPMIVLFIFLASKM